MFPELRRPLSSRRPQSSKTSENADAELIPFKGRPEWFHASFGLQEMDGQVCSVPNLTLGEFLYSTELFSSFPEFGKNMRKRRQFKLKECKLKSSSLGAPKVTSKYLV